MRFLVMHKVDAKMEAGERPNQDIIRNMGALVGESLKSGVFKDGAGLHRSVRRVRVTSRGGDFSVERGPYAGKNELVSSLAMIKTRDLDEAIAHGKRLAAAIGDCELEIGSVVEGWDLTGTPKPENVQHERYLVLLKGDATSESGAPRKNRAAVDAVVADLKKDGVLVSAESLAASAKASRTVPAAKRAWTDGPFTESKELIAGFSLIDVPSKKEAFAWADRYAAILTDCEVDVRLVHETSGFAL
jgi:hypothetical protein